MDSIKRLTDIFSRFPTIGPRTAGRFVYYLISQPKEVTDELVGAILELKNNIKICSFCFNPFEGESTLCDICKNPQRNRAQLCIVEKENDLLSIDHTKKYHGLYFIIGKYFSSFKKSDIEKLRIQELVERIKNSSNFAMPKIDFSEIIIAINSTPEGKSASILIQRALKELLPTLRITHLAQGLPIGSELEYADEETLESAFEGRK